MLNYNSPRSAWWANENDDLSIETDKESKPGPRPVMQMAWFVGKEELDGCEDMEENIWCISLTCRTLTVLPSATCIYMYMYEHSVAKYELTTTGNAVIYPCKNGRQTYMGLHYSCPLLPA